jgi:hypothetical protein
MNARLPDRDFVRQFCGLFVGISRYRFTSVRRLASASRGAKTLHTVFCDNLGSTASTLLVDPAVVGDGVGLAAAVCCGLAAVRFEPRRSVHALHHAVRSLRATGGLDVSTWRPFRYTGP